MLAIIKDVNIDNKKCDYLKNNYVLSKDDFNIIYRDFILNMRIEYYSSIIEKLFHDNVLIFQDDFYDFWKKKYIYYRKNKLKKNENE